MQQTVLKTVTKEFGVSREGEAKFDLSLLESLGAGRGGEPSRGCPRRILSQYFAVLQGVAIRRKLRHK